MDARFVSIHSFNNFCIKLNDNSMGIGLCLLIKIMIDFGKLMDRYFYMVLEKPSKPVENSAVKAVGLVPRLWSKMRGQFTLNLLIRSLR